jgi:hypothetical protein
MYVYRLYTAVYSVQCTVYTVHGMQFTHGLQAVHVQYLPDRTTSVPPPPRPDKLSQPDDLKQACGQAES